jgi:hypothetical protein
MVFFLPKTLLVSMPRQYRGRSVTRHCSSARTFVFTPTLFFCVCVFLCVSLTRAPPAFFYIYFFFARARFEVGRQCIWGQRAVVVPERLLAVWHHQVVALPGRRGQHHPGPRSLRVRRRPYLPQPNLHRSGGVSKRRVSRGLSALLCPLISFFSSGCSHHARVFSPMFSNSPFFPSLFVSSRPSWTKTTDSRLSRIAYARTLNSM